MIMILVLLQSCGKVQVSMSKTSPILITPDPDTTRPSLTIEQAFTTTVGTCSFTTIVEPVKKAGFSYLVTFSEAINSSTFTVSDISNAGTGGAQELTWALENCGDDKNFKLTTVSVDGNGTIIPQVAMNLVSDVAGNLNLASTSIDNSVNVQRMWFQEAYIKAVNNSSGDQFGNVISLDGETLAVASPNEDSNQNTITNGPSVTVNDSVSNSGAVYVYRRSGQNWNQEAYIKASNNQGGDDYGYSISLNQDSLAVSVRSDDSNVTTITNGTGSSSDNSKSASGAVFVYRRSGVTWVQEAYIKAANADASDYFGHSVSIFGDTLAVGATGEASNQTTITNGTGTSSDNSSFVVGAVYVYRRSGVSWTQEAYIKSRMPYTNYYYGSYVRLSQDTLAVSAWAQGSTAEGGVFIYRRSGVTWSEEAFLEAGNKHSFAGFGYSISLDHNTLAVGSNSEDSSQNTITNGTATPSDRTLSAGGAVYIYKRTGTNWIQEAYVKSGNVDTQDYFGYSVALDGDTLAVTSFGEDSNQITITNGPGTSSDNSSVDSGAVYVFKRKGVLWSPEAYIKSANSNTVDRFGSSISVSGDTLAVSAPMEDSNQSVITNGVGASSDNSSSNSGAVYIYRFDGRLFEVTKIWGTSTSNSITLKWNRTGGLATGYIVTYASGLTAPATCSLGTVIHPGNVNTHTELALSASTNYSFRVCATDGTDVTEGRTFTISTTP